MKKIEAEVNPERSVRSLLPIGFMYIQFAETKKINTVSTVLKTIFCFLVLVYNLDLVICEIYMYFNY